MKTGHLIAIGAGLWWLFGRKTEEPAQQGHPGHDDMLAPPPSMVGPTELAPVYATPSGDSTVYAVPSTPVTSSTPDTHEAKQDKPAAPPPADTEVTHTLRVPAMVVEQIQAKQEKAAEPDPRRAREDDVAAAAAQVQAAQDARDTQARKYKAEQAARDAQDVQDAREAQASAAPLKPPPEPAPDAKQAILAPLKLIKTPATKTLRLYYDD
jgi:hypothetical protein